MSKSEVHVLPDAKAIAEEAADRIVGAAAQAIQLSGTFTLALSGGSTPKTLHQLLASDAYRSQIDWSKVEIYFGDERTVPPDHADSNYRMAHETLLSKVPIPPQNIHRMRGEIDPNEAAIEYGRMLKARFGETGGIDLILLGMGDDGHTASLFPSTEALRETHHRCLANFVPKLNTWRITMSAPFLNRSREVLILVSGASKAHVLAQVLHGPRDQALFPVQMIQPTSGKLYWLVDKAASSAAKPAG
ncbi:MAG TPA: 6-phosphogluconolactonase [Tepidisphaeraceae bacterium]|jgi:6-phosphogluconolactonase